MASGYGNTTIAGGPAPFPRTRWTIIQNSQRSDNPALLHELLVDYWRPLYSFLRAKGYEREHAKDAVQGFFLRLFERSFAAGLDQDRGRFRSYLIRGLKNYLANEHHKSQALRRGGDRVVLSLDDVTAGYEPAALENPDHLFERQWALCLLDRALAVLETEYAEAGKGEQFAALAAFFRPAGEAPTHESVAAHLSVSRGNLKVMLHRMRRRYAELVRREIRDVVAGEDEVEEELRHLFAALRHPA